MTQPRNQDHAGRVALITGAGSGVGRATALQLAAEGARVSIVDIDLQAAESVAKEIAEAGGEAFACRADVASEDDDASMVSSTVERFGALHLAFLNAGVAKLSSILDGDFEVWKRVVDINLHGVFLGMRATAPAIIEAGGGAIVATASIAGLVGGRGMPSYYATKHAVIGLVRSAAAEFARYGIRVNAVCPGVIDTPILGDHHGNEEITSSLGASHLVGRLGRPEEVAEVVSFLLSDRASFVSGAEWKVDSGMITSPGGPGSAEADAASTFILGQFSGRSKAFD